MSQSSSMSSSPPLQKCPRKTTLRPRQSIYVFDPKGDTQLTLSTYQHQHFNWESETLWIEQKAQPEQEGGVKEDEKYIGTALGDLSRIDAALDAVRELNESQAPQTGLSRSVAIPISFGEICDAFTAGLGSTSSKPLGSLEQGELGPGSKNIETKADGANKPEDWSFGERPGNLPGQVEIRMLVSGKHLEIASPYFRRMFAGPYVEGRHDLRGLRTVTATDWDPKAFNIILNIIHGYHWDVPKSVSLEMLANMAIIVDYYECYESIDLYLDIWFEGLKKELPTTYGRDCMLWIFVCWVFSRPDTFQSMTRYALQHSTKLIEGNDVPIPIDLLEKINQERQDALDKIFSALYKLLDHLLEKTECSYECSSILLGSLTKELKKNRILMPRIVRPFHGFSIEKLKGMIKNFQGVKWHTLLTRGYNSVHSCTIDTKLGPILEKIEKELREFRLEDFQFSRFCNEHIEPR